MSNSISFYPYPDAECKVCGISSFAHLHREGTKPRDFERIDTSEEEAKSTVNPTKQHAKKCPKLYGEECKCDSYHTFDELYEHRIALWIALCAQLQGFVYHGDARNQPDGDKLKVWRSKLHSDGTSFEGWFILGLNDYAGEQITYHLPLSKWDATGFAQTLKKAPPFDGHTSDDVLARLTSLAF